MTHAAKTVATLLALAWSVAPSVAATPHLPARKAIVAQPAERLQGCLNGAGLMHAAYLPTANGVGASCGHFLSTDTMMTVHHWDRT